MQFSDTVVPDKTSMRFLQKWFRKAEVETGEITQRPLSFVQALNQAGLKQFEQRLEPHLADSIFIKTTPANARTHKPGSSHIGGLPDLPAGADWPSVNGTPLGLVAQFNLTDIQPFDKSGLLPSSGSLFFFYDSQQGAWGFDPNDRDYWRVLFHPGPAIDLKRASAPDKLSEVWKECAVQFSSQPTVPENPPEGVPDDEDQYFKLRNYLGAFMTHHQLLGHESPVQGDVKLECQLVSNGLYCGDASGYQDPRAKELERGADDWLLLFQADSDDNAEMMWGDVGRLYFCIRKQDLRDRRFDKVWMVFQCH
ncbi:MAG TPA: YwqG family protein [Candidatus Angelobacter sp.]